MTAWLGAWKLRCARGSCNFDQLQQHEIIVMAGERLTSAMKE